MTIEPPRIGVCTISVSGNAGKINGGYSQNECTIIKSHSARVLIRTDLTMVAAVKFGRRYSID